MFTIASIGSKHIIEMNEFKNRDEVFLEEDKIVKNDSLKGYGCSLCMYSKSDEDSQCYRKLECYAGHGEYYAPLESTDNP